MSDLNEMVLNTLMLFLHSIIHEFEIFDPTARTNYSMKKCTFCIKTNLIEIYTFQTYELRNLL